LDARSTIKNGRGAKIMTIIVALLAIGLLWFISILHIYWAFGGRWGAAAVIPVKVGEHRPAFTPRKLGTILVAIVILLASFIVIVQGGFLKSYPANTISNIGSIVCAVVFMIRAIGDFNYVGFFKKIKHSQFARNDTWMYSPICLFLGVVYITLIF